MRVAGHALTLLVAAAVVTSAQAAATVTLDKAALVAEATNDQRETIVPPAGQKFLWITGTLTGPRTIVDLTKVTLSAGAATIPLLGVDSAWGGDPKQFSMTARVQIKGAAMADPLEETRSVGAIGFAFTPGKEASLKVNMPPQSFCLLFAVPATFSGGTVKGLGAKPLAVPPAK